MTRNEVIYLNEMISDLAKESFTDYFERVKYYNFLINFFEKDYRYDLSQILNRDNIDPAYIEAYMEIHS